MLKRLSHLKGAIIHTTEDRQVGEVEDFYFDDATWTIRYIVVKLGSFFNRKHVLISPESLRNASRDGFHMQTRLSEKELNECPLADSKKPISRLEEEKLYDQFGWPIYWGAGAAVTPYHAPFCTESSASMRPDLSAHYQEELEKQIKASALRSANEVIGYKIHSATGTFGNVEDFILEDQNNVLKFLVIETIRYLPSKSVLIAHESIEEIDWDNSEIRTSLSMESIKSGPEDYREMSL